MYFMRSLTKQDSSKHNMSITMPRNIGIPLLMLCSQCCALLGSVISPIYFEQNTRNFCDEFRGVTKDGI